MARITDELRKWGYGFCGSSYEVVNAIADRIDEAHEALRDQLDTSERQKESYREDLLAANRLVHASYNDGFDDGFASADDWLADHEDAMAEHGWVKLPVDADGEVWHVGDFAVGEVNPRNPKAIERMIWYGPDSGWQLETNTIIYPCPDRPRHHHAPTVEDVLEEFASAYDRIGGEDDEHQKYLNLIAEFAAKLRLAEGGEG